MKGCYKYLFIFLVSFFFINLKDVKASETYGYSHTLGFYIDKDSYFSTFSKSEVKNIVEETLSYYDLTLESERVYIWYYKDNYILVRPNYAETYNSFSTMLVPIDSTRLGLGLHSPYLNTTSSYTNIVKTYNTGNGWSSPTGLKIKSSGGLGVTPTYNGTYMHAIDSSVSSSIEYLSMHSLGTSYTYSSTGLTRYLYEIEDLPILLYASSQSLEKYGAYIGPIAYTTDVSSNPFVDENGTSNVLMDLYHYNNLDVVSKIEIGFDYIEEHIKPNNGSEVLAKIGANIHTTVSNCDTSLNNIYYSFDNGKTYTQANSCSFDVTVYKNTDFYVKVTDLENNLVDSSLLSLTQIMDPTTYMNITYEDATNESDYVEVDGEKILNNGRFKVLFDVPNIEYYSYVCDFEFLDSNYNSSHDITEKIITNNYLNITLEKSGNLHCKILDKNKNLLFENYSDTLLLSDREKLGPYVTYTKECSEDNSSCTLNFKYLNFDSTNYKYYYSIDSGYSLIENTFLINDVLYYWSFTSSENVSVMIIIKDKEGNVVFSNNYLIDSVIPTFKEENFKLNIFDSFEEFKKEITEVFKLISYFFNRLPYEFQLMFYIILVLLLSVFLLKFLL